MQRLWLLALVGALGCRFDASGTSHDAGPAFDADPNAPDASTEIVEVFRDDPFGDGTKFSFVVDYATRVYVGPSDDGTRFIRYFYNNSSSLSVPMTFPGANGNLSGATPPFSTIGSEGCTENTDCGPDNESLRGFAAAGTFMGDEWLILGGARDGPIDHIYMTNDSGTGAAEMKFIDLSGVLGGQTKGLSAIHIAGDHAYLGFADTGSARPYLLDLIITPNSPGFEDAAEGTDVFDMDGDDIPGFTDDPEGDGTVFIDFITSYNDRLYVANEGAWVHSVGTNFPVPYLDDNLAYGSSTPSSADYTAKTSRGSAKVGSILPAERAVPSMVEYQGTLYAARNTTDGPQLWRCDNPGSTCDGSEWSLMAPNSTGDAQLSQFDNPNNTAVTLLESTGTHLYVGFDNEIDGVVLYRTDAVDPIDMSDFEGDAGCVAGSGCPGLGGTGFGKPTNKQFLDSEAIDTGAGIFVYATVGDLAAPLIVYRFAP